jgi:hypothetical protein
MQGFPAALAIHVLFWFNKIDKSVSPRIYPGSDVFFKSLFDRFTDIENTAWV